MQCPQKVRHFLGAVHNWPFFVFPCLSYPILPPTQLAHSHQGL